MLSHNNIPIVTTFHTIVLVIQKCWLLQKLARQELSWVIYHLELSGVTIYYIKDSSKGFA